MRSRTARIVPSRLGRERDRVRLMAGVRGAGHVLAPALDPLHRPAERHRDDGDQRVLRVSRRFRSEPAAEIGRDHPDLVGRQPERAGEPLLDEVRDLGRVPRGHGPVASVPRRDDTPVLERHAHVALDVKGLADGHVRPGERAVGVADRMREADPDVVAPFGMNERRAWLGGTGHVDDGRQEIPFDPDQVHRVFGALGAVGHHHRDDLADIARAIPAERPLRRLADFELDDGRETGGHRAEERQRLHPAFEVAERQHARDAWRRGRRRRVDAHDARVGVGRPEERRVEHTGHDHVFDKAAFTAEESRIFPPLHRRAEKFRAHGSPSPRLYTRFPRVESCAILAGAHPRSRRRFRCADVR